MHAKIRYKRSFHQHCLALFVVFRMYDEDDSLEALVLAAGEGSRLKKYTEQKVLEPLAKIPLLGRILRRLKKAGIAKVHIVVGYEGDSIEEEIGDSYLGIDIDYITARNWAEGNLYSLMAAKAPSTVIFSYAWGIISLTPKSQNLS